MIPVPIHHCQVPEVIIVCAADHFNTRKTGPCEQRLCHCKICVAVPVMPPQSFIGFRDPVAGGGVPRISEVPAHPAVDRLRLLSLPHLRRDDGAQHGIADRVHSFPEVGLLILRRDHDRSFCVICSRHGSGSIELISDPADLKLCICCHGTACRIQVIVLSVFSEPASLHITFVIEMIPDPLQTQPFRPGIAASGLFEPPAALIQSPVPLFLKMRSCISLYNIRSHGRSCR